MAKAENAYKGGNTSKATPEEAAKVYRETGFNLSETTRQLGYSSASRHAVRRVLKKAREDGFLDSTAGRNSENLSSLSPVDDLIAKQKRAYEQKKKSGSWRKPHVVKLDYKGPFMVCFLGDEHVDDDGTDLAALDRWIDILDEQERVYGFSLGDWSNNWLRFLGILYGEQTITADEGWELVKHYIKKAAPHMVGSVGGNHDGWDKGEHALGMVMADLGVPHRPDGMRISFKQKGCATDPITIGSRHAFSGTSIYNTAHGVMRAAIFGWQDTLLVGGHLHVSGSARVKNPDTGFIVHCEQVASFKLIDRYADQKGLMDKHISPAVAYVFQPWYGADDPRRAIRFDDPEDAKLFLEASRTRFEEKA